jgi:hypothetical protein
MGTQKPVKKKLQDQFFWSWWSLTIGFLRCDPKVQQDAKKERKNFGPKEERKKTWGGQFIQMAPENGSGEGKVKMNKIGSSVKNRLKTHLILLKKALSIQFVLEDPDRLITSIARWVSKMCLRSELLHPIQGNY